MMEKEKASRKAFEDWMLREHFACKYRGLTILLHDGQADALWHAWKAGIQWVDDGGPVYMEGDPK